MRIWKRFFIVYVAISVSVLQGAWREPVRY